MGMKGQISELFHRSTSGKGDVGEGLDPPSMFQCRECLVGC
jgi:hypothetical protein